MAGVQKLALLLAVVCGAAVKGGEVVNFMSIQMEAAEQLFRLPNLPKLAAELKLESLVENIEKAGLAGALSEKGPFTVFGPTDSAFIATPDWLKKALQNNATLVKILKYHVLSEKVLFKEIQDEHSVTTLQGRPIRFNIYPNNKVYTAQCGPIDKTNVDKMASNGVLHELKSVMVPPFGNIVETVSACTLFTTLVKAVKAADLVEKLSGKDPFTLFAPTNDAFNKLPEGVLDNLLKNKTALTDVLTYHVISLTYCSVGLISYHSLQMVNGQNITIKIDQGQLKVNDATVLPVGADGSVTNGVVHAIDTVLMPPSLPWYP